jgi:hypothetical protein
MRKTLNIINSESTEGLNTIVKSVDLSNWQNIDKASLKVQLHAEDPTIPLVQEWRLTKILINDKVFYPSDVRISTNKIHDNNDQDYFKSVLTTGKNRISITWIAPLGAGVISPHSRISAQLIIDGDQLIPIPEELATLNTENITNTAQNFINKATLPTFAILIIVMIIAIFVFLALSRGATIATTAKEVIP